jgi:hypothetical protein
MGGEVEYRVFFDGKPADRKLYDRIESIVVDQGLGMMSEARMELRICASDKGLWDGPSDDHATPWKRIRVEARNHTKEWIALIDGPIVAPNPSMFGEPGQSTMTVVVRDDSAFLNIEARTFRFEGKKDDDIVKELVKKLRPEPELDMDPFPARPADRPLKFVRAGTEMDLLTELARPYGRHVYVRPSATVGRSVVCIKNYTPPGKPKLPALVLTGPTRNMDSFSIRVDAMQPARFTGARLDIDNVEVDHYVSKWSDVEQIGEQDPFGGLSQPQQTEHIDPLDAAVYDVVELANARQQRSSFAIVGNGSLRAGCYRGVLTPYELIGVSGVPQKFCTNWMIRDVTHTLGRSEYRQDFTVVTNSVAKVGGDATPRVF